MTAGSRRAGLSKSKITMFEQCPRRLWLSVHQREAAVLDDGAEARFAAGHEVGSVACALLPDGIMVEAEPDLSAALERTRTLLDTGHDRPIFEATLEHDGVLVRIDVLEPDGSGGWRMAEVKSSTKAKPYHVGDLATQLWVANNAGLAVSSAAIRHLDSSFTLEREGDFAGLFADTNLMEEAAPIIARRAETVAAARSTLSGPDPETAPGAHCDTPFPCEFSMHCHSSLPTGPEWPVTVLPNGGGKRWLEKGIENLADVDLSELRSEVHRRVHRATMTAEPWHDVDGARAAMAAWSFPRTWLDFETIAFAVPRWVGTRPYQQVPFQFSAHVEHEGGDIDHHEFLSLDGEDPRHACAEELLAKLPAAGAIIAYNAPFERQCIRTLAAYFPDLTGALEALADRIVDLLPVTRACWYHRDQRGSWSIKAVLPTIGAGLNYSELDVKDGARAQEAYLEAICAETPNVRRAQIDTGLRAYCGRDTEAMIALARHLESRTAAMPPIGINSLAR